MKNHQEKLIIGLTGSFASGCGSVADYLENKGFRQLSLSTKIKEVAKEKGLTPDRENLQDIGDDLRKENGNDYLAKIISKKLDESSDKKYVVKSFRNNHEIQFAERKYPSFFLFNIDATGQIRYIRVQENYTRKEIFDRDDERDSGEDQPEYGQHVRLCVDMSDVVINNNEDKNSLYNKIDRYIELVKEPGKYPPYDHEVAMSHACRESTRTGCLKRAVGAVITKDNQLIASGYNSTPKNIIPCVNLSVCYKDETRKCPNCGARIQLILDKCNHCENKIEKQRIAEIGKNLDLCRAIHAEERAILQLAKIGGPSLKNSTLYTTTFPCILCAKKIIEVGIEKIYYIDPYPYQEAMDLLSNAKVIVDKFQGVKSRAFDELYERQNI